jgi:hypothetical protein
LPVIGAVKLRRRELLKLLAAAGLSPVAALAFEENSDMNLEQTIHRLQDRVEIEELMARYCRYADQLDPDGMAACFVDDCVVGYVPASIAPPAKNKNELLGFLRDYFPHSVSSAHYITNVELVFDSADVVTAHSYMYSWQRFKAYPAAADCHRYGRYEYRIVRTAAGWRFSHLNLLSAGEYGGARIAEQFGRPWPPRFG